MKMVSHMVALAAAVALANGIALADDHSAIIAAAAKFRLFKAQVIRAADKSVSGDRIAALPFKFVGKHVDLHCTVVGTDDPTFFDAACPKYHLAIEVPLNWDYQRALKVGQTIRVLGRVEKPWGGIDEEQFPAVQALFIDKAAP